MAPKSERAPARCPTDERCEIRQPQSAVTRFAPAVILLVLAASCSDTDEHAKLAATRDTAPATQLDSAALADAGAFASSRIAIHFAGQQGFSSTTLRERATGSPIRSPPSCTQT